MTEMKTELRGSINHFNLAKNVELASRHVDLPNELLRKIFHYIVDSQNLRSIALSCRRFHKLVIPLLFRSVYVTSGTTDYGVQNHKLVTNHGLRQLTLHLLRKRSFASYVKHIRLRTATDEDYSLRSAYADQMDIELQDTVEEHLHFNEVATMKLVSADVSSFKVGDQNANLILFLALLPQLETLHLQIPDDRLLANGVSFLDTFDGLRKLTLEWMTVTEGRSARALNGTHLKNLLSSDSIRELCLVQFECSREPGWDGLHPFAPSKPQTSSVTHLEFRQSRIRPTDYDHLIPAFKSLKTFVFENPSTWNQRLAEHIGVPLSLWVALQKSQKDCLENLWLDCGYLTDDNVHVGSRILFPPFDVGKTSEFSCLKHVAIPLFFLLSRVGNEMWKVSMDCLPQSLESLILFNRTNLRDCFVASFMDGLVNFFQNTVLFRGLLPKLSTFVFVTSTFLFAGSCGQPLLDCMDKIPGLNFILASQKTWTKDKEMEDFQGTESIHQIEESMSLTKIDSDCLRAVSKANIQSVQDELTEETT